MHGVIYHILDELRQTSRISKRFSFEFSIKYTFNVKLEFAIRNSPRSSLEISIVSRFFVSRPPFCVTSSAPSSMISSDIVTRLILFQLYRYQETRFELIITSLPLSLLLCYFPWGAKDLRSLVTCLFATVIWVVCRNGEQGWRSGESARLPPMCPGFDSWTRPHMWTAPRGFSPGTPVFPSPQKPTFDLI